MSLELRGIRKHIGPFSLALDLHLAQGEFFALVGPSGCGKTTTLHIAAGFLTPDAGSVYLDGRDITYDPPERRSLGLVFQQYALFPHLDVAGNVGYGLSIRRRPKELIRRRTEELLQLVRLPGLGSRATSGLSGGEQQRIALARALAPDPRALLLDEPLSALDASLRTELRREILRIQREAGIAALYVTHDQEEALSLADRIAVMKDGAVVQVGTPRQVYEHPTDCFSARFLGSANLVSARITGRDVASVSVRTPLGGFRVRPAEPSRSAAEVPGSRHVLFFRPDHLHPVPGSAGTADDGNAGENIIEGIVRYVEYQGGRCLLEIEGAGLTVTARLPDRNVPVTGERIRLRVDPEDLRLLPADEE